MHDNLHSKYSIHINSYEQHYKEYLISYLFYRWQRGREKEEWAVDTQEGRTGGGTWDAELVFLTTSHHARIQNPPHTNQNISLLIYPWMSITSFLLLCQDVFKEKLQRGFAYTVLRIKRWSDEESSGLTSQVETT